ncbi:MAG: LAGLIDADG family homing endonuclease [Thermomicrobiales bacterium]
MTISDTRPSGAQAAPGTVLEGVRSKVFMDRYSLKDQGGKAVETTPEQMWRRVARGIADVEQTPELKAFWEERFYEAMEGFKFVPGGRILSGAGTGFEVTYYNCYVIESPDDSRGGILDNLKYLTEIMARGGGVGVNLSTLRPRGSYIKSVNGTSSGPVSWAELYSVITGRVIQQGGTRRGALMIMLDDDHPDIEEFIAAKRIDPLTNKPVTIEHANVSVAVSDAFMQAVKDDADWNLQFPTRGNVATNPELASKVQILKTVKAREIWNLICTSAWNTAEPGLVFIDRYNTRSNTWYYENIRCVNPCFVGSTRIATDRGLITAAELAATAQSVQVLTDLRAADEARMVVGGTQRHTRTGTVLRGASPMVITQRDAPVYTLRTRHGYSVTATAEHRFLTPAGYVELRDLRPGDGLYLQSEAGSWNIDPTLPPIEYGVYATRKLRARMARGEAAPPTSWSKELGQLLGWLSGDGWTYDNRGKPVVAMIFGADEQALLPRFRDLVRGWFGVDGATATRNNTTTLHYDAIVARFVRGLGFVQAKAGEKRAPDAIWSAPREAVIGYLQGLFTSDGTVNNAGANKRSCSIRLASSSRQLLEDVQQLLLNLGLVSRLHQRREAMVRLMPGSDRTPQEYQTSAQYELLLDKENRERFAREIGFLSEAKQARIDDYTASATRGAYRERFVTEVASIEPAGRADVYDLTEPETHSIIIGGIVSHQCGEQGLPPWGVCNLGALNLSAYVDGPIGAGTFNFAALEQDSRIAMRFLDNVVDANLYFLEENAKAQLGTRRTGLGTMGLADALIKLGVAYGSPEAVQVIDRIYRTIRDAAYDMSADISAEKGACPDFDAVKYPQGQFILELPEAIQAKIRTQGIRNAVLLTQAPTGTTSLLSGVSSGIEPVFSFAMKRVDRTGEHIMYHPLLQQWRDAHPGEETPGYFVASSDLSPEEHIAVQARVQQYTDSSISKTVNAPNDHTVEEVKRLYLLAYDTGCKGVTYYRDGSRDAVLTHIKEEKQAAAPQPEPIADPLAFVQGLIAQAQLDGRMAPLQAEELRSRLETAPTPAMPSVIRPRPAVLHGYTRNIKAPEGTVNITINNDEDGPVEVFVNVGRAGSDVAALAEAMGRLVSLALRIPSPISQDDRMREVVSQLRGIGGSRTIGFGPEQVRSLPDAVGKALGEHLDGHPSLTPPPQQLPLLKGAATVAPTPMAGMPALTGPTTYFNGTNGDGLNTALGTAVMDLKATQRMTGNLCPECGSSTLVYEEGCKKCLSCGHSEC